MGNSIDIQLETVSKLNIASHNGVNSGLELNGEFRNSTAEDLNKLNRG